MSLSQTVSGWFQMQVSLCASSGASVASSRLPEHGCVCSFWDPRGLHSASLQCLGALRTPGQESRGASGLRSADSVGAALVSE